MFNKISCVLLIRHVWETLTVLPLFMLELATVLRTAHSYPVITPLRPKGHGLSAPATCTCASLPLPSCFSFTKGSAIASAPALPLKLLSLRLTMICKVHDPVDTIQTSCN